MEIESDACVGTGCTSSHVFEDNSKSESAAAMVKEVFNVTVILWMTGGNVTDYS